MTHPNIYNIPPGHSFADTLAKGILEQAGGDPLVLSAYTVLLPNRRAVRTLREAFLRLSGEKAILLPRLQPVGDVDADDVALLLAGDDTAKDILNIPPAISKLQRQVLLARTILKTGMAASFDQAAALATELGRFLDEIQTEGLSFDGLKNLVPEEFAGHWQQTLTFLQILTENWPSILQERGVIDQAARRNLLLAAQIAAWTKNPPQTPVIAAGSTGTVPAAAELLSLVARLPRGQLVLPGLDIMLDDDSWNVLTDDHPQYNMKHLLARIGVDRSAVQEWPVKNSPPVNKARVRLMSEALRPAATTEKWRALTPQDISGKALEGLTRIDCATPQEEADVVALLLRQTLETPGKTAALITPDRRLARRVTMSLRRWGIDIDDSGGQPLTELPVGSWLTLTAEMAEENLAPVTLLSVLKHPMMAGAMPAEELRNSVYALDQLVLRGPRHAGGFDGLHHAVDGLDDKLAAARASLRQWLEKLQPAMHEFLTLMTTADDLPFNKMLTAHVQMAEALATTENKDGAKRLWQAEAGEAAADYLGLLLAAGRDIPPLRPAHYVSLLKSLLKSVTVRARYGTHPRLSILGQVEARLYCADKVILGGLNEGSWPDLPAHDPWMSRPMRKKFGLPSPEKSISLAAHDFVQAATAPEVIITRARKVDGTPTVPARWLLRMETVLKAVGLDWFNADAALYRQWARDLDLPAAAPKAVMRPQPRPPVAARPRELSVTQIEKWMRDPYQIYAQKILRLKALDPLDADPGGAERGTFIHAALEKFVAAFPDDVPPDARDHLLALGKRALVDLRIPPEVEAFWWPRFEKVVDLFIEQEKSWRQGAKPYLAETSGRLQLETPGGAFALTGKADRIDRLTDGAYAIIDYKSGYVPKPADVKSGLAPQLVLEAMMLENGAFDAIKQGIVDDLIYWKVSGSGQTPVEFKSILTKDATVRDLVDEAAQGLRALIDTFDDPSTPYICQPVAADKPKYSDYDHLARVKEWSIAGDAEDAA